MSDLTLILNKNTISQNDPITGSILINLVGFISFKKIWVIHKTQYNDEGFLKESFLVQKKTVSILKRTKKFGPGKYSLDFFIETSLKNPPSFYQIENYIEVIGITDSPLSLEMKDIKSIDICPSICINAELRLFIENSISINNLGCCLNVFTFSMSYLESNQSDESVIYTIDSHSELFNSFIIIMDIIEESWVNGNVVKVKKIHSNRIYQQIGYIEFPIIDKPFKFQDERGFSFGRAYALEICFKHSKICILDRVKKIYLTKNIDNLMKNCPILP